jgi:hypothetical protein
MTQLRPHPDLLLWQDCEFTGFSLSEGHRIYEIAAVVTDRGLHEIESYASFIYIGEATLRQLLDSNPYGRRSHGGRLHVYRAQCSKAVGKLYCLGPIRVMLCHETDILGHRGREGRAYCERRSAQRNARLPPIGPNPVCAPCCTDRARLVL